MRYWCFFRPALWRYGVLFSRKRYGVMGALKKALWRYEGPPAAPPLVKRRINDPPRGGVQSRNHAHIFHDFSHHANISLFPFSRNYAHILFRIFGFSGLPSKSSESMESLKDI